MTAIELGRITPFDTLPAPALSDIAEAAQVFHLHDGESALSPDGSGGPAVFAILSGRVRLVEAGQTLTLRHLYPGEVFGHFTLLRDLPPPYRAEASEACELCRIPKDAMLRTFERHRVFADWFGADLRRFERELGAFDDIAGSRFLFGQRLRDLEAPPPPVCRAEDTMRDAARLLSQGGGDFVLVERAGRIAGMISDRDFRRLGVAEGWSPDTPVGEAMNADLLTIPAKASVFEGIMAMERRGWHHLVLLAPDGDVDGVISDADLARTFLANPAALRRQLGGAESGEDLRRLRARADRTIVTMYRRAVRADDILGINTRFNDALTVRAIEIAAAQLSAPPQGLVWCWLSLGSEGRGEMGLRTDQDNAIVYRCPDDAAAQAWLADLAARTNLVLAEAGIALCDGGIMAREAEMRRTPEAWSAAIEEWTRNADDARLLWVAALADLRPLHGAEALAEDLKSRVLAVIGRRRRVLHILAREALATPLPVRRFPTTRLRGTAGGRKLLNVKRQGDHLIVGIARLLCLEAGWLTRTSTAARLGHLAATNREWASSAREAQVAADVLTDLRMNWHVEQVDRGQAPANDMPLSHLGETRKRLLLGAYETVGEIRHHLRTRFGMSSL